MGEAVMTTEELETALRELCETSGLTNSEVATALDALHSEFQFLADDDE